MLKYVINMINFMWISRWKANIAEKKCEKLDNLFFKNLQKKKKIEKKKVEINHLDI